eukprot:6711631-Prymnesium_polylepis.1
MARDEDAMEMVAAEQVAIEADDAAAAAAAQAMAAAADADTEADDEEGEEEVAAAPASAAVQAANVRPHNRAGSDNNRRANNRHPAVQVPVRRRKVLR